MTSPVAEAPQLAVVDAADEDAVRILGLSWAAAG